MYGFGYVAHYIVSLTISSGSISDGGTAGDSVFFNHIFGGGSVRIIF